jgi:hypothetical protein
MGVWKQLLGGKFFLFFLVPSYVCVNGSNSKLMLFFFSVKLLLATPACIKLFSVL